MSSADPIIEPIPAWTNHGGRKVLIIATSPRENGNSHLLANGLYEGAQLANHDAVVIRITPYVKHMMRYCRECRNADGACGLDDRFSEIFRSLYRPADAVVFATPIWWYGMTAHMKNFLDRIACEISASGALGDQAKKDVMGKRIALLLSAEESNFGSRLPLIGQFNEPCRHMRCRFVGHVTGLGNLRGEVKADPLDPIGEARMLGQRLFEINETDYELDSQRDFEVWQQKPGYFPSYWR